MNYFLDALKNYATFSGRATRQQYWMFVLFSVIFSFLLGIVDGLFGFVNEIDMGLLSTLFSLAILIPSIAILARRLHDIGRTGWWILLIFIPLIGAIVILIFTLLDSEKNENQYGESLKYPATNSVVNPVE